MSFDPALPAPNKGFTTTHKNNTGFIFAAPDVGVEEIYERQAGDQYRDHGRNMMMKVALDVIEKQKEFRGVAAEEFAQAFQKQTIKISEAVKKRVERQQILPAQLLPLFKEPNLRKFPNKSGHKHRMTGAEAALAEEADRERALQKIKRKREIKDRLEAELAALEAESPDNTPKNKYPAQDLSCFYTSRAKQ